MFLIFGQFWNQTTHKLDWQQIGGTATSEQDAVQFAEGFSQTYKVRCKVVGRGKTWFFSPGDTWVDESELPSVRGL